jgi:hypothetical protein
VSRFRVVLPALVLVAPWVMAVPASAVETGPVLVAGTVLGADGGATVVVSAWPSQKELSGLRVGDVVPVLDVARTAADAAGRFAVPASVVDRLPEAYRGPGGQVDLQVRASAGAASTVWSTSVVPTASGWTSTDVTVGAAVRGKAVLSLAATGRALGARSGPVTSACQVINLGAAGPTWAVIANVWGNPRTAYGRVQYTVSSSHTLGTAVSRSGAVGDFEASGSMTRTSGLGFDTNYTVINHQIQGAWWYQKYFWNCVGYSEYELRPGTFYTGPRSVGAGTRTLPYACAVYQAGWEFHRESGANHSFSTGVNVGGVGVVSQVGWTRSTSVFYKFGRQGRMCASQPSGLFQADFVGSA